MPTKHSGGDQFAHSQHVQQRSTKPTDTRSKERHRPKCAVPLKARKAGQLDSSECHTQNLLSEQPAQPPPPSFPKVLQVRVFTHVCLGFTILTCLQCPNSLLRIDFPAPERETKSLEESHVSQQNQLTFEPAEAERECGPLGKWLAQLPPTSEDFADPSTMYPPPAKRLRSMSPDQYGQRVSLVETSAIATLAKDKQYATYKHANYPAKLETKGSYMRPSKAGMADEDRALCQKLKSNWQPVPFDPLFDDDHFMDFLSNLQGRSEARVYIDLHPRIVPSVEGLSIAGRKELEGLIDGYNDIWVNSVPFHGPRPQPDHTIGFKWSNFSEKQRRKLKIATNTKSYYIAREEMYFPFFTSEIKCGKQGLDFADLPNAHSMTVALRGLVDVYRQVGRPADLHRKVLGFSISHNEKLAYIYAHYPEIDGDRTTYYRDLLEVVSFWSDAGRKRWFCYQFTLNVCQMFALPFLEQLKSTIDELPDPIELLQQLAPTVDEEMSIPNSEDETDTLNFTW
ncbi:hypothetical protein H2198_007166 [Neophaeococcomyces mojaviensis]|uniref:Uncharacterized protein n=1 Tax=Neophaeococcomyces mojaviensis TaxID=3383035 RepID=A0ACC3A0V0_9EURO|nr:hypothetical protein H2198_007166 [Knufia sp. JES_112]